MGRVARPLEDRAGHPREPHGDGGGERSGSRGGERRRPLGQVWRRRQVQGTPASDAAAPKPKKAKTEKPADKDKVIDKDKDGKPSKPAAGKAKSAKAPKAEKSEAVPAAPAPAPPAEEVRLDVNLSVALKRELIAGWERITRENKLVALPRDVTVADVLARFVADAKTRARNPEQAALAEEIADGLRAYFDGALKPALLYREERGQAETVLASRGGTAKAPSEVYGAEHLLRLFVKLPELLPLGDMDAAAGRALQVKLTEFLRWLQRNAASSFGGAYVERDAKERGNGGKEREGDGGETKGVGPSARARAVGGLGECTDASRDAT